MTYTAEEISLIDGLFASYFMSASDTVREKYLSVHAGLVAGTLTKDHLIAIKDGLYFLLPLFETDKHTHKTIISAIATTHIMIKGAA